MWDQGLNSRLHACVAGIFHLLYFKLISSCCHQNTQENKFKGEGLLWLTVSEGSAHSYREGTAEGSVCHGKEDIVEWLMSHATGRGEKGMRKRPRQI